MLQCDRFTWVHHQHWVIIIIPTEGCNRLFNVLLCVFCSDKSSDFVGGSSLLTTCPSLYSYISCFSHSIPSSPNQILTISRHSYFHENHIENHDNENICALEMLMNEVPEDWKSYTLQSNELQYKQQHLALKCPFIFLRAQKLTEIKTEQVSM